MLHKIVVWYNPKKGVYYHRIISSLFYDRYDYVIGSENSYGHRIIDIIPESEYSPKNYYSKKEIFRRRLISFLKKI